jgi:hypothetical protein
MFKISDVPQYAKNVVTGAKTVLQTPGWKAKGNVLFSGAKGYADSGKDGPDAYDAIKVATAGPWGALIGSLNYIGQNQPATMPQAQYVPTGNSVFGNSMGLDSYGFFANAPQSIGSNFYNAQPLSSFGQLMAPQYGQLPDLSNNAWYQGPGAGSMGPVPPAPQAPVQAPVAPVAPAAPAAPATTISGITGAPKPTPTKQPYNNALAMYNAAPMMGRSDINALNMKTEAANMVNDPSARQVGYTSIAQRFNPLAGHEAHVRKMDLAKYAGELSPDRALEDAKFNEEMAAKIATMAQ